MSGLRPKYTVQKLDEFGRVPILDTQYSTEPTNANSTFVLFPRKDPAAFTAMLVYAQNCEAELAKDIFAWLTLIAVQPVQDGTQGRRNRIAMMDKEIRRGMLLK